MEKSNILLLLTPKNELKLLDNTMCLRQAVEKMRAHEYLAVPVINKKTGEYLGSISQGDLLWTIVDDEQAMDKKGSITKLIRKDYCPAVKVDADIEELLNLVMVQNFVPVVDDRNVLMGIVTRRRVINELLNIN